MDTNDVLDAKLRTQGTHALRDASSFFPRRAEDHGTLVRPELGDLFLCEQARYFIIIRHDEAEPLR